MRRGGNLHTVAAHRFIQYNSSASNDPRQVLNKSLSSKQCADFSSFLQLGGGASDGGVARGTSYCRITTVYMSLMTLNLKAQDGGSNQRRVTDFQMHKHTENKSNMKNRIISAQ